MRRDHRPYWMHQAWERLENAWARHFLHPHFERIGPAAKIVRPWHVEVFGPNISVGTSLHVIASSDSVVRFTVWAPHDREAAIEIGDACLFSGGTRILAAKRVTIGHACMFAANTTVTDCDWHGLYDRIDPAPEGRPVTIGDNVWIGDGAFVGIYNKTMYASANLLWTPFSFFSLGGEYLYGYQEMVAGSSSFNSNEGHDHRLQITLRLNFEYVR